MAGNTSTNVTAVRRRFVAAKYKAHARDQRLSKPRPPLVEIRLSELERLYTVRCGRQLPNDDAGRDDLLLAFNHIAGIDSCIAWAKTWAPWLSHDDALALAEQVAAAPQWLKARPLGERLGLTDAERTALKIGTIRPIDVTDADLVERRRRKNREREALKRRLARQAKPAPASQTKPWESEGIDRATWYRRKAKSGNQKRATKSVCSNAESFTAHGNSRTGLPTRPRSVGPHANEGFSIEKGVSTVTPSTPKTSSGQAATAKQVARNWQYTEGGKAYALSRGIPPDQLQIQAEQFVLWHLAKGKRPWPNIAGAWKSWCDRYLEYEGERREKHEQRSRRDRFFSRMAA